MMPFYVPYVIQPESVPECKDGKRAILGLDNIFDTKYEMFCQWETWLGVGLVMLFLANAASMPLWLAITKRLGKVRARVAHSPARRPHACASPGQDVALVQPHHRVYKRSLHLRGAGGPQAGHLPRRAQRNSVRGAVPHGLDFGRCA